MIYPEHHIARIKRAELLSTLGAGVLGGGIALLFVTILGRYAVPLLLLGLVSHTIGMFQKHSLEQQGMITRVVWAERLYWLCWVLLAALFLYIVFQRIG